MKLINKDYFEALCEIELVIMTLNFIGSMMENRATLDPLWPLPAVLYLLAAFIILTLHAANNTLKD